MGTEIIVITKKDFENFKQDLLADIRKMIGSSRPETNWIRSSDVKKMLKISDSTLQTMRINGAIPAYKIDSTWFYKYDEISAVLESSKLSIR